MMVPVNAAADNRQLNAEIRRTLTQTDFRQRLSNEGSDQWEHRRDFGHWPRNGKMGKVARRSGVRIE
jgi:hypothetical protein